MVGRLTASIADHVAAGDSHSPVRGMIAVDMAVERMDIGVARLGKQDGQMCVETDVWMGRRGDRRQTRGRGIGKASTYQEVLWHADGDVSIPQADMETALLRGIE